ncbi:MAG: hypothetical protein LBC92_00250, partial [Rickettsiales bacterium]|nr:hypothetical protein [Rickettsiales bacterium]
MRIPYKVNEIKSIGIRMGDSYKYKNESTAEWYIDEINGEPIKPKCLGPIKINISKGDRFTLTNHGSLGSLYSGVFGWKRENYRSREDFINNNKGKSITKEEVCLFTSTEKISGVPESDNNCHISILLGESGICRGPDVEEVKEGLKKRLEYEKIDEEARKKIVALIEMMSTGISSNGIAEIIESLKEKNEYGSLSDEIRKQLEEIIKKLSNEKLPRIAKLFNLGYTTFKKSGAEKGRVTEDFINFVEPVITLTDNKQNIYNNISDKIIEELVEKFGILIALIDLIRQPKVEDGEFRKYIEERSEEDSVVGKSYKALSESSDSDKDKAISMVGFAKRLPPDFINREFESIDDLTNKILNVAIDDGGHKKYGDDFKIACNIGKGVVDDDIEKHINKYGVFFSEGEDIKRKALTLLLGQTIDKELDNPEMEKVVDKINEKKPIGEGDGDGKKNEKEKNPGKAGEGGGGGENKDKPKGEGGGGDGDGKKNEKEKN